jgi:hypothetical protein
MLRDIYTLSGGDLFVKILSKSRRLARTENVTYVHVADRRLVKV